MYLHVTIMLTLQTTVAVCTVTRHTGKLCMGAVGRHRRQPATLIVYTQEGAVEAHHVEHRCKVCGTGYWHINTGNHQIQTEVPQVSRE